MDDDLSVREPGIDTDGALSPEDELALAESRFRGAELDEAKTMWDADEHPKPPHDREEAVTSRDGSDLIDVQAESVTADIAADVDLSDEDLRSVDLDL